MTPLQKHLYKIIKKHDEDDESGANILSLVENICFLIRIHSAKFKPEDVAVPIAVRRDEKYNIKEVKIAIVVHDTDKNSFVTIVSAETSFGMVILDLDDKVNTLMFEALKEVK